MNNNNRFTLRLNVLSLVLLGLIEMQSRAADHPMEGKMDPRQISFTHALYGFSSKMAPFQEKTNDEIASQITSWGANAVFLKDEPVELMKAFHRKNIRCYRSFGFFQGGKYWENQPGTRPIRADGLPLEKEEWYCGLCPNQDELQQEKLLEIREIAKIPGLDGIWLDFFRYPVHWESPEPNLPQTCFCPVCLKKFVQSTKVQLPFGKPVQEISNFILADCSKEWYEWRAGQITDLARRVKEILEVENPDIQLGLFGIPWARGEREDAIFKIAGQNFASLAASIDIFSPMVYHRMCGEPVSWIHTQAVQMSELTGKPVWPIIQGCNVPDTLTPEEFKQAIQSAEQNPSQGVIIFGLNHLVNENRLDSLAKTWNTQGEK